MFAPAEPCGVCGMCHKNPDDARGRETQAQEQERPIDADALLGRYPADAGIIREGCLFP